MNSFLTLWLAMYASVMTMIAITAPWAFTAQW